MGFRAGFWADLGPFLDQTNLLNCHPGLPPNALAYLPMLSVGVDLRSYCRRSSSNNRSALAFLQKVMQYCFCYCSPYQSGKMSAKIPPSFLNIFHLHHSAPLITRPLRTCGSSTTIDCKCSPWCNLVASLRRVRNRSKKV